MFIFMTLGDDQAVSMDKLVSTAICFLYNGWLMKFNA